MRDCSKVRTRMSKMCSYACSLCCSIWHPTWSSTTSVVVVRRKTMSTGCCRWGRMIQLRHLRAVRDSYISSHKCSYCRSSSCPYSPLCSCPYQRNITRSQRASPPHSPPQTISAFRSRIGCCRRWLSRSSCLPRGSRSRPPALCVFRRGMSAM